MAAANTTLLIFVNGTRKALDSKNAEVLFKALGITSDGIDNGATITEVGGHFHFNSKNITSVGTVDGRDVSADGALLDTHLTVGGTRHAAGQISVLDTATIYTATDVEAALAEVQVNANSRVKQDGTTPFSAAQSMGGFKLTNVAAPTAGGDAVNKTYADGIAAGFDPKESCRYATIANIASILSASAGTVEAALDMVSASPPTIASGNRLLVKNQTTASENGIYRWTGSALVRTDDFDGTPANEVSGGGHSYIDQGDLYAGSAWAVVFDGNVAVGTDPINWTRVSGSSVTAGAGLTLTGSVLDIGTGDGIQVNADDITVKLDGGTLAKSGSGLKIATDGVGPTQLATDAVTSLKIAADAVTTAKILNANVTEAKIATDAVTAAKIAADAVTTVKILNANVTEAKIATDAVTTVKIAANAVTKAKLDAGFDGAALAFAGEVLNVQVASEKGVKIISDALEGDYAVTMFNGSASVAIVAGDIVYIDSTGKVQLAKADVAALDASELGIAEVSIPAGTGNSGKIVFRRGWISTSARFSGLTPGAKVWVSRGTAGAVTQSLTGFVSGEHLFLLGRAKSATEVVYAPEYEFQYA